MKKITVRDANRPFSALLTRVECDEPGDQEPPFCRDEMRER
jgi:hypothetical protein